MMRAWTIAGMLALGWVSPAEARDRSREMAPIAAAEWVTSDDYPAGAVRRGEEGNVAVVLDVTPAGIVAACRVDVSSGFEELDRASCDVLRARARFTPALDRAGRVVAGTYRRRIAWRLPVDDGLRSAETADQRYSVLLDADGREITCGLSVDGKTVQLETCPDLAVLRQIRADAGVTARARFVGEELVRHGELPPALPPVGEPGARLLLQSVERAKIDGEGRVLDCSVAASGEVAVRRGEKAAAQPCPEMPPFRPLLDAAGRGTKQHVLVVKRVLMLPPAP